MNTPIAVAACIALICSVVFCLESGGYVGEEELGVKSVAVQDEPWRFITFMFTHGGIGHLLTNLIGLILVGILAWEMGIRSSAFLAVFVGVGILTVAPAVFLSSPYTFVGASAGVAGLFGATSVEFKRYGFPVLPIFAIFALAFAAPLMMEAWYVGSAVATMQAFMHLFALTIGASLAFGYRAGRVLVR